MSVRLNMCCIVAALFGMVASEDFAVAAQSANVRRPPAHHGKHRVHRAKPTLKHCRFELPHFKCDL